MGTMEHLQHMYVALHKQQELKDACNRKGAARKGMGRNNSDPQNVLGSLRAQQQQKTLCPIPLEMPFLGLPWQYSG